MLQYAVASTRYFKRYRMDCELTPSLPKPTLPAGFSFIAWDARQIERHALVKFMSFRGELDSDVFPCLGEYNGCSRLMMDISRQERFIPAATWLISWQPRPGMAIDCGTIQGVASSPELGAIQNVGVSPDYRGQGLGRSLVLKALWGFRSAGLRRVSLEVTAANDVAVGLYRSIGFTVTRTMYRSVAAESAG